MRPCTLAPADVLALQRTAGNAAVSRMVAPQRMLARSIVAIDGPTDGDTAKKATTHCLENLRRRGTRGASMRMAYDGAAFSATPGPALAADDQTIYILGHGSAESATVSGLTPDKLADALINWFGSVPFHGKIKLVSCTTAVEWDLDAKNQRVAGVNVAEALAGELRHKCEPLDFQPSSVDGVRGICWVDERTSRIMSLDLEHYVTIDTGVFGIHGRHARQRAVGAAFQGHIQVGKATPDATTSELKGAKLRYAVL